MMRKKADFWKKLKGRLDLIEFENFEKQFGISLTVCLS
jgi:hypothetical protein